MFILENSPKSYVETWQDLKSCLDNRAADTLD